MMHSDVKMSETNSGIGNILIAVFIFLTFLYTPLVQTVVNGKVVESFTVAENLDKDSGGFYLFLISLMAAAILVIGILKLTLSKVFQHFVVSVVDFYYSLGLCIGFILMAVAFNSQSAVTSYWGAEIRQMMGLGPALLIIFSLIYFVAALGQLCSFYKWYPLQTLAWGLHPVINILATSLLSLVAAVLIPDSADDMILKTAGVIISWGVFFVEIWLLVTYRKKWNCKLRARAEHNTGNADMDSSASPASIEKQQWSPQEQAAIDKAVERMQSKSDEELKDILANPKDYSKSFLAAADIVLQQRKEKLPQDTAPSTAESPDAEISDMKPSVVKVTFAEPSAADVPKVSPAATEFSTDKPQSVTPSAKRTVEVHASSKSRKKYYIIGGASALAVLLVLFFCLKGGETVEVANVPIVQETFYKGKIGKLEVEMCLEQEGDSLYGTYFYKRNKQDIQLSGKIEDGRYIINEFVGGKNTGTFNMVYDNYNDVMALCGTWSNGKKEFKTFLADQVKWIIPSADPKHPFVGEWRLENDTPGDSQWACVQLKLYNKDTNSGYGFLNIAISDDFYWFDIVSVLQLKGNKAIVRVKESGGEAMHEYALTYNPSDRSLEVNMENGSLLRIPFDGRSLEQRIADAEALNEELRRSIYDSQTVVYEDDVPPPPPTPELLTIVEDDAPASDEEQEKEAERARLQAELATELAREIASEEDPNKIYDNAEVMPEFPGGQTALMRYIAQNMKYPKIPQEYGTQGKVVVQFVVDADGNITNAQVITSVDPYLDTEALRVINSMPRWTPGKLNGKPVRVKYTIPIMFRLS